MSQLFYKGISPYTNIPNRYPYLHDVRPVNTLYGSPGVVTRLSGFVKHSKPYPLTDRPGPNPEHCSPIGGYIKIVKDEKCHH